MKKTEQTIKIMLAIIGIATLSTAVQMCTPPPPVEEEPVISEEELRRRELECQRTLSSAWEYYRNREFESSIRNYLQMVELGCAQDYAESVYLYFGRAYIELGKLDSAAWAFRQGLRYLPEDEDLLELVAYVLGRLGDTENQIYYYERLIDVDTSNTEAYRTLTDLYRKTERWRDLVIYLRAWGEIDPGNTQIQSELIDALARSGEDPLTFIRQRWEGNPSNVQYGMEYAERLLDDRDYTMAYRVIETLIQNNPTARAPYERLANAALDNGDIDRAISTLLSLFELDRTNAQTAIDLSQAYLRKGDYAQALRWADTAYQVAPNKGEALYYRAEVYYTAADDCVSTTESGVAAFNDKLVFQMAYEDYQEAVDLGYRRARTRADFLQENLIPTRGDWFLQEASLTVFRPEGECYSWITRTVNRP